MTLPRDATDEYLKDAGHELDIVFDVDLGELVDGHHVIARGIDLGRQVDVQRWEQEIHQEFDGRIAEEEMDEAESEGVAASGQWFGRRILTERDRAIVGSRFSEAEFHYEFVPGLREDKEGFYWYWMLQTFDDVGTTYSDSNGGARGPATGGPATHATRDLGGRIPDTATRLRITFEPASGWVPPEPWIEELEIDLRLRSVISAD